MAELQVKGIIEDELNLNFLLQTVRFENEKTYRSVDKLFAKIGVKESEIEKEKNLSYEIKEPSEIKVKDILNNINKLYEIYRISNSNEELTEGVRKEILKLIALLLWNFYH
jgi:hypothetical protein